ncbi:CinA family protein [Allorhodopirellula solitaria]|uniref:Putative competence-damage inducible protein n=1 Tax=Allorhodopirellula solitaria TaxID=2527987 RepID=A0A5C5YE57_9BACT|nr:nicotinamide-nucleotide amidohydrolase family protein [Allorhodopirellula solitaria]TWT73103.1 putative competence-damage inducible protein [Allorhodopirellula solitaria]
MTPSNFTAAAQLVDQLRRSTSRIALAESCTCGMTAALLGGVPGASEVFCGSAVTYRESVKSDWLGVETSTLREFTAESQQTTDEMARCLLDRTREADWCAAITGHLGPNAPRPIDGRVYVSLACRPVRQSDDPIVCRHDFVLKATARVERQVEAAQTLIGWILDQTATSSRS